MPDARMMPSTRRVAATRWLWSLVSQIKGQNLAHARRLISESGLFDADWYVQRYPDVAAAGLDPLEHFASHGGFEGRKAGPEFDSLWYVQRYPDAAASGLHPLVHFVRHGAGRRTRKPIGIPGVKQTPDDLDNADLILTSPLFDTAWYVRMQELDLAGPEAALHYLKIGGPRGASPGPLFDGAAYLKTHRDVRKARINPLLHYIQYGREQGREIVEYDPSGDQSAANASDVPETAHVAAHPLPPKLRITLVGNCQMLTVAKCLSAMLPSVRVHYASPTPIKHGHKTVEESVGSSDVLFIQTVVKGAMREEMISRSGRVVRLPMLAFGGFHPDLIHAHHDGQDVHSFGSSENSAIALYAWMNGLNVDETVGLFRDDVFKSIGYLDSWDHHIRLFNNRETDIDLSHLLTKDRCFMLSLSHPKLEFCAGVARAICDHLKLEPVISQVETVLIDEYVRLVVMPVYPEVGAVLGLTGEYAFKAGPELLRPHENVGIYSLRDFVEAAFDGYNGLDPNLITASVFNDAGFLSIRDFMSKSATVSAATPGTTEEFVEVLCDEELYDRD